MGRELSEDRFHKLERQLALAKGFAEDMQAAFQECEDHATALDEEAEKIQEEVKLNIVLMRYLSSAGMLLDPFYIECQIALSLSFFSF